jgi:hypothetical protein
MFEYPLKKRELFIFLQQPYPAPEFDAALSLLINESIIYDVGGFFSLQNNLQLAERRNKGNAKAERMLKKASVVAKLLSKFPYVRGVAISGSLSKNFADETADIDFFIIAAKNRLWIARTWLHAFKKLTFLFNKQHFFCMNYFIDELQPAIVEKNIYTATEIVTLLPLYGIEVFEKFFVANSWTKEFLPNNYMRINHAKPIKTNWFKEIVEKSLNNRAGNFFENRFMNMTAKSWNAKTKRNKRNSHGVVMSLNASKHWAKPDPVNFQDKLLKHYENKLADIFENYENVSSLTAGGI